MISRCRTLLFDLRYRYELCHRLSGVLYDLWHRLHCCLDDFAYFLVSCRGIELCFDR